MRRLLCCIMFLGITFICLSGISNMNEFHVWKELNVKNGLTDNQVQHIMQLPDGRMMVTTFSGIGFYDGEHISYARNKLKMNECQLPSYTSSYEIYYDGKNIIWIKDYHRLLAIDLKKKEYINAKESVEMLSDGRQVLDLFMDSSHGLYLLTADGIFCVGNKNAPLAR